MRFVKLPNNLFELELSAKALQVYAYLQSIVNQLQCVAVKYDTIAERCNMSVKTAQAAIKELAQKELVSKQNRYNHIGYISNRYFVTNLIKDNKNWFGVPCEVFDTRIKATDFVVYCFINKCMSNKKEAFPSLNAISKATRISRSRVVKAVAYLRTFTYINRVKRKYRKTRAYRHNRYIEFKCNKKVCAPSNNRKVHTQSTTLSKLYTDEFDLSNTISFSKRGWCLFYQTYPRPTELITNKKE